MASSEQRYAAAWVPDDVDQHEAVELALDWFDELGYREGPLLVCNTVRGHSDLPTAIQESPLISPQSRDRHDAGRGRPVLVLWPFFATLELAATRALNGALCVVASYAEDVTPWVTRTTAVNLAEPTAAKAAPDGLGTTVTGALDSILFFGGRNGFIGAGEKEHTVRLLRSLVQAGSRPDVEAVVAYARASGQTHERGIKQLRELYEGVLVGKQFRDYARRPI